MRCVQIGKALTSIMLFLVTALAIWIASAYSGELDPAEDPAPTMRTLEEIYIQVQNLQGGEPPKTGQTVSYIESDDGDLQKGQAWPTPRFTDNGDGTVADNLTGLIWLKNANCFGSESWENAIAEALSLSSGQCGLGDLSASGDWRLPNIRELKTLIHYALNNPAVPNTAGDGKWGPGNPFTNVQSDDYWTGTVYEPDSTVQTAWTVNLFNGAPDFSSVVLSNYVWPVRSGQ